MNATPVQIIKTPIQPMDCITSGYALIKDQYWLFLGISFVGMMIGSASMYICLGAMMCGIYMALFAKMRGEKVEFGTLFKGFDVFVPSLIPTIIMLVLGAALIVPFYIKMIFDMMMMAEQPNPEAFPTALLVDMGFMMAGALVLNIFYFFLLFAYQLIADHRADGLTSITLSFKAVAKNFWGLLGLCILLGIFSMVAFMLCYIPGFLFMPVMYAAMAVAYSKVFPVEPPSLPDPVPPPSL
ncbi:MAG: hypothetical protein ACI9TH_001772 [Kiritimatiellia bacterium]|jgi:hypothetical protein